MASRNRKRKTMRDALAQLVAVVNSLDFSFGRVQEPETHERLDEAKAEAERWVRPKRRAARQVKYKPDKQTAGYMDLILGKRRRSTRRWSWKSGQRGR